MSVRSIWTGTLSFGLVSFGVKAYKATDEPNAETSMRQLHNACAHPINQKTVCFHCDPAGATVPYSDIVKGVEQDGAFIVLSKEELDSIKPESSESIAVEAFIDAVSIDPLYVANSYFLAAEKGQQEAFVLMQAAMVEKGKVAQARMTIYGREHIVTIRPMGSGLVLQLMRSKNEVREMDNLPTYIAPGAVAVKPEMLALANGVVDMLSTAAPDYTEYEDAYVTDFKALVASKASGVALPVKVVKASAPKGDLMAALKASLAAAAVPTKKVKATVAVKPATKLKKAA